MQFHRKEIKDTDLEVGRKQYETERIDLGVSHPTDKRIWKKEERELRKGNCYRNEQKYIGTQEIIITKIKPHIKAHYHEVSGQ